MYFYKGVYDSMKSEHSLWCWAKQRHAPINKIWHSCVVPFVPQTFINEDEYHIHGFALMNQLSNYLSCDCREWMRLPMLCFIFTSISAVLFLFAVFFRVTQIKTYSWDNAQVVLVGNKCDLKDDRVVSFESGNQLAEQLGT